MESPAKAATPPPFPKAKRSLRILYADDVPELRDVARISLEREGHTVECVEDGQQAWERIEKNPEAYDVVITDHHMPVMNGMKLVTNLRATPYRGRVVVFSSELSQAVNRSYQALQVDKILYKPVLPSELRSLLRAMAEKDPLPPPEA